MLLNILRVKCLIHKLFTSALFILTTTCAFADENWKITPQAAECILNNISSYTAIDKKIVIIAVENCPNPDFLANAMKGKKNFGGAMTDIKTTENDSKYNKFISYPKIRLTCLNRSMIKFEDDYALFPKVIDCEK